MWRRTALALLREMGLRVAADGAGAGSGCGGGTEVRGGCAVAGTVQVDEEEGEG